MLLIFQKSWESETIVIPVQLWHHNVHLALQCLHIFWPTMQFFLSFVLLYLLVLSSALQYPPMTMYFWLSLNCERLLRKCVWLLPAGSVWYEVSLFVTDCKLARTNQNSVALVIVWLFHGTTIVYLYRPTSHVDILLPFVTTLAIQIRIWKVQTFQLLYSRELCSLPVVFTFYTSCTSLGSHCH